MDAHKQKLEAICRFCREVNMNYLHGRGFDIDAHRYVTSYYTDAYETMNEAIDDMYSQLEEYISEEYRVK